MIENVLSKISRFVNRLVSSRELRPLERMVLNAWRETLSSDAKRTLDTQLQAAELLQRQAKGAKVCFYYPKVFGAPLFDNRSAELHAATVILSDSTADKEHAMPVKVFLVKGRFFSMEFPKRPARYAEQHRLDMTKLRAVSVRAHANVMSAG
jgi:hypothetical protein